VIPEHLVCSRRAFLRALGVSVAASALSGCATTPARNVLFIAIDDMNDWTGDLGGHPQARTPHIDALGRRGVLFTNAHSPATSCGAARAAILTGIRPYTSGIYANRDPLRRALPDAVTLPQHFMQHRYHAAGAGKIFHGSDPGSWTEFYPLKRKSNRPPDPDPGVELPMNGIHWKGALDWGPIAVEDAEMSDGQVAAWVARWLHRSPAAPFFLACGIRRPHDPFFVPKRYFDLFPLDEIQLPAVYDDDLDDVPDAGRKMVDAERHRTILRHGQWRNAVQGYLASIAFADEQIGTVIRALDESGRDADTIVVLWTDHGFHLGEKSHWRKDTLWEEATRVPFIVVAPGVTRPGSRCARPVNLIDLYPTLIELCDLAPRNETAGVSLVPLLHDPDAAWDRPSITTNGRGNNAARDQHWRYIRYANGTDELYDHRTDPFERANLADHPEYAHEVARLAEWLPDESVRPTYRRTRKSTRGDGVRGRFDK